MNKLRLLTLASFLMLSACHTDQKTDIKGADTVQATELINGAVKAVQYPIQKKKYAKTIKIDYHTNQDILDILPLIPDSAMESWQWTKTEREQFLNSIKTSNSFVDTTENYNTIVKVLPNYLSTQPVDGIFELACYQIKDGNYIVITNDKVGDGKKINTYELSDGKLGSLNPVDVFGPVIDYFLAQPENEKCRSFYEDAASFMSYQFSKLNTIGIYAGNLEEKEAKQCLKGNYVTLNFNKNTKKFELKNTKWQKFKD